MVKDAYEYYWKLFVDSSPSCVWTPFWHMKKESFWHFKPKESSQKVINLVKPGGTASLKQMQSVIDYAYLDEELFNILKTPYGRSTLFLVLKNYIKQPV